MAFIRIYMSTSFHDEITDGGALDDLRVTSEESVLRHHANSKALELLKAVGHNEHLHEKAII